jgi:hypothetical protein
MIARLRRKRILQFTYCSRLADVGSKQYKSETVSNHDDYDSVMKIRSSIVLPSSSNDEEKLKFIQSRKVSMDFISLALSTPSAIRKTISRKVSMDTSACFTLKTKPTSVPLYDGEDITDVWKSAPPVRESSYSYLSSNKTTLLYDAFLTQRTSTSTSECDELLGLKFIDVDRKQKSIKLNNYQIECHNFVALLKEKVVCCMSSVDEQNTVYFIIVCFGIDTTTKAL